MPRISLLVGAIAVAVAGIVGTTNNCSASAYSDAVQALNPDAYFRFDGTTASGSDETGNHDFTGVDGGIAFNVAGPRPTDFAGMDAANNAWDFVPGTRASVMDYVPAAGQQPRTVIGWFNTDVTRAQHGGAIDLLGWNSDINSPNTFKGWNLKVDFGNDASSIPFVGPLGYDVISLNIQGREITAKTTPIVPDTWYMVGVVYNGGPLGTAEIYINGVLQELVNDTGVTPEDPGMDPTPYPFYVGRALGGFAMDGQIDHVAVYVGESVGVTGDYNNDGTTNAADYTVWRDTLGATVEMGTGADGNNNGMIDAGDYDVWKDGFGGGPSLSPVQGDDIINLWNIAVNGSGAAGLVGSSPIPEPHTLLLAGLASLISLAVHRRGKRSF